MRSVLLVFYGLWVSICQAQSSTLIEIYDLATQQDPVMQRAHALYQAAKTLGPQARAALLPRLDLQGHTFTNKTNHSLNTPQYHSHGYRLRWQQPLFNPSLWSHYQHNTARTDEARSVLYQAEQQLILRTAEAYFAALDAQIELKALHAKKISFHKHLHEHQQKFAVGTIAVTDVHAAQARYDLVLADLLTAENNLHTRLDTFYELTKTDITQLRTLATLDPKPPEPNKISYWTDLGLKRNLLLQQTRFAVQAAQHTIHQQQAELFPTLTLEGSHSYQRTVLSGTPVKNHTSTLGINAQFNLFQGGGCLSRTRAARADYQAHLEHQEQTRRKVITLTQVAFRGILTQINRIQALQQAVLSNQSALEATRAAHQIGTRTLTDVLDAESALFDAQKNHTIAQHKYLLQSLRLQHAAGVLTRAHLETIDALFTT